MKSILVRAIALALLVAGPAWGAGGGPDTTRDQPKDPVVEAIQDAIAKPDWARARELARAGVAKDPASADYHNLYAYTIRMGANPEMELVFKHYNEALRLDPKHRGAHEYLGEAYLMAGNLAKAKEHLRTLDGLCFFACKEYSMLKKAVADYEAKRPAK
jgi:tetratricopeptide (TPR) repeat protein